MLRSSSGPRRRRLSLALVVGAALVVGGVVTASTIAWAHTRPAVDGVQFDDEELALVADRAERTGADGDDTRARVEVLRDDLALFAVARELGATDVTRPADILSVLDDVNRDRAETAAAGGVLYGPVRYDARSFYGTSLTDIRRAVLTRLETDAPGAPVSDAEIRARFDADPGRWADAATTYHLSRTPLPAGSDGLADPAVVQAARAGDWGSVVGGSAVESVALSTEQLAAGALSPDATAALAASVDGAVIGPVPSAGGWVAYRLEGRTVDAEQAFAHYHSRIRSELVDERLDALVAEARSVQDVRLP